MTATILRDRVPDVTCGCVRARIECQPDEAARPIEQGFSVMNMRDRLGNFWDRWLAPPKSSR